jgi:YVTN family beta-propeller protein
VSSPPTARPDDEHDRRDDEADGPVGDPDVVGGKVWAPIINENRFAVVDPATNTVVQSVKLGTGPFVVTRIAGQAWVPSWKGADVWRLSP